MILIDGLRKDFVEHRFLKKGEKPKIYENKLEMLYELKRKEKEKCILLEM